MKKVIDIEKERDKYDVFRKVFEMDEMTENELLVKYLEMKEIRIFSDLSNLKFSNMVRLANYLKGINNSFIKNREKHSYIIEYYYTELLDEMCKLADELELINSLEISNLYSYLLWNGYLSKNKQNISRTNKANLISGLYFSDIMNGVGDCINHSDMLKDFLNRYGYNASSMINLADKKTTTNYKPNIEQQKARKGIDLYSFIMNPIIRKAGNHVFTLIEENNKFYIYDSSNLNILSIENPYVAKIINGKGIYQMHPFLSSIFNIEKNYDDAISNLFYTDNIIAPYDEKDFIEISSENIEKFKKNILLFEYFYDEVRSDILNIAEETNKIKMKKRGNVCLGKN